METEIEKEVRESVKADFAPLMEALASIAKPLKMSVTYAGELLRLIKINGTDNMEFKSSNYTASGCEAVVKDKFDSQLYRITIEPLYEKGE